jgi:hypothetical protein
LSKERQLQRASLQHFWKERKEQLKRTDHVLYGTAKAKIEPNQGPALLLQHYSDVTR